MATNSTDRDADKPAICFGAVLAEELQEIHELRKKRKRGGKEPASDITRMAVREAQSGPCADDPATAAREAKEVFDEARVMGLVGLAFSGGGIRSATFNLGILQGLAKLGRLRMFDYVSTVSGGGYIGSWLEAWIWREGRELPEKDAERKGTAKAGIEVVEEQLNPARVLRQGKATAEYTEPPPIRFLREYSSYLTPHLGLLGADTWAAIAIYLRNLLLNQAVLILFLFSLLLLPHIAVWITKLLSCSHITALSYAAPISIFALVTLALCLAAGNLKGLAAFAETEKKGQESSSVENGGQKDSSFFPQKQGRILAFIVGPLFLAAWILTGWLWGHPDWWRSTAQSWRWAVAGLVGFSVPWMISLPFAPRQRPIKEAGLKHRESIWAVSSLFTGPLAGLLLFAVAHEIFARLQSQAGSWWHEVSFGVPLVVLVFLVAATLQVGFMGREFFDFYREWWGRLGGWLLILSIAWAASFGLVIYSPLGLLWSRAWLAAGGIVWVATTLAGVIGGKSSKTGALESKTVKEALLSVTPYVFIAGLVSLLSLSLELILARVNWSNTCVPAAWSHLLALNPSIAKAANWALSLSGIFAPPALTISGKAAESSSAPVPPAYITAHWQILGTALNWYLVPLFVLAFVVCLLMAWRVDLNEFSVSLFYRNRLVRCYLGATNKDRHQNPFTGLDSRDDFSLTKLHSDSYSGPFPIFNATLNLVSGRHLAWQERKAASFSMTPLRCGYDTWLERLDQDKKADTRLDKYAYRQTEQYLRPPRYKYGGLTVGRAVSISGAALSPNMGYYSRPGLAALLTFFNVRLGFWAGNPRDNVTWRRPGPRFGLIWLLEELLGRADDDSKYVYLSDGGHFENLGVYELVKRRCKYIIACDAGADPQYALTDLANAIRKCREDIGVEITLDTTFLVPQRNADDKRNAKDKRTRWHCSVGEIRYDMVDAKENESEDEKKERNGIFVYVKASLTGDEPADVLNYQTAHEQFPHETTADQWFSETQFESYRRLGQHIIEKMFEELESSEVEPLPRDAPPEKVFDRLKICWGEEGLKKALESDTDC